MLSGPKGLGDPARSAHHGSPEGDQDVAGNYPGAAAGPPSATLRTIIPDPARFAGRRASDKATWIKCRPEPAAGDPPRLEKRREMAIRIVEAGIQARGRAAGGRHAEHSTGSVDDGASFLTDWRDRDQVQSSDRCAPAAAMPAGPSERTIPRRTIGGHRHLQQGLGPASPVSDRPARDDRTRPSIRVAGRQHWSRIAPKRTCRYRGTVDLHDLGRVSLGEYLLRSDHQIASPQGAAQRGRLGRAIATTNFCRCPSAKASAAESCRKQILA